jgi:hypothetical protein
MQRLFRIAIINLSQAELWTDDSQFPELVACKAAIAATEKTLRIHLKKIKVVSNGWLLFDMQLIVHAIDIYFSGHAALFFSTML